MSLAPPPVCRNLPSLQGGPSACLTEHGPGQKHWGGGKVQLFPILSLVSQPDAIFTRVGFPLPSSAVPQWCCLTAATCPISFGVFSFSAPILFVISPRIVFTSRVECRVGSTLPRFLIELQTQSHPIISLSVFFRNNLPLNNNPGLLKGRTFFYIFSPISSLPSPSCLP